MPNRIMTVAEMADVVARLERTMTQATLFVEWVRYNDWLIAGGMLWISWPEYKRLHHG